MFTRVVIPLALVFTTHFVAAEGLDKSSYNLFKPTPADMMRELSTDRPDKTESPYTVDAGHFQIEADLVSFVRDRDDASETTYKVWNFGLMNLKSGLTNSTDLQFVLSPYREMETDVAGVSEKKKGFGESIVRLKWNVFGNEGQGNALALMPFIKLPTSSDNLDNDKYEGGLIVPLAIEVPNDFGAGAMIQVNRMKNESDDQYHTEFIASVTVSHDLIGELGGYLEFYSESSTEDGVEWIATTDVGFTYGLSQNLQLDLGANFGVTDAADNFNGFLGIAARF